jgi:hypothetical protein
MYDTKNATEITVESLANLIGLQVDECHAAINNAWVKHSGIDIQGFHFIALGENDMEGRVFIGDMYAFSGEKGYRIAGTNKLVFDD